MIIVVLIIIITKSHDNYRSVGVMELCLLNLLILSDCFLCNSYPCVLFESLLLSLTRNHMFIPEIWGKFTSLIFWNFEISLVSLGRFQNFKKVNSVNLSQISLFPSYVITSTKRDTFSREVTIYPPKRTDLFCDFSYQNIFCINMY